MGSQLALLRHSEESAASWRPSVCRSRALRSAHFGTDGISKYTNSCICDVSLPRHMNNAFKWSPPTRVLITGDREVRLTPHPTSMSTPPSPLEDFGQTPSLRYWQYRGPIQAYITDVLREPEYIKLLSLKDQARTIHNYKEHTFNLTHFVWTVSSSGLER